MDELIIFEGKVPAQQMREAVVKLQETLLALLFQEPIVVTDEKVIEM